MNDRTRLMRWVLDWLSLAAAGLSLAIGRFLLVQSRQPNSLGTDSSLVIGGKT